MVLSDGLAHFFRLEVQGYWVTAFLSVFNALNFTKRVFSVFRSCDILAYKYINEEKKVEY